MNSKLPLVYSCSGASSAAQMANHLAVALDRRQVAEMSCIAGLGGDVKPLVRVATSGRPLIALDGCPLHCTAKILARHGLTAARHYDLSELNVKKHHHEDFDPAEAARVLRRILDDPEFPGRAGPAAVREPRQAASPAASGPPAAGGNEEIAAYASPPCSLAEIEELEGHTP